MRHIAEFLDDYYDQQVDNIKENEQRRNIQHKE